MHSLVRRRTKLRDEWLASGFARFTRDGYASCIRRFFAWCDARGTDVFAVSATDLDAYRSHLASRGLAPGSVERGMTAVRSFYRFADSSLTRT